MSVQEIVNEIRDRAVAQAEFDSLNSFDLASIVLDRSSLLNMADDAIPLINDLVTCVEQLMPGAGQTTVDIGLLNDTLIKATKYRDKGGDQ